MFPIKCPTDLCNVIFKESELKAIFSDDLFTKYVDFQFKKYIEDNNENMNHCPTPKCPYVFEFIGAKDNIKHNCRVCKGSSCILCKVPWHEGYTCEEYRKAVRSKIQSKPLFKC